MDACLNTLKANAKNIDVALLGKVTKAVTVQGTNHDVCTIEVKEIIKGPAKLKSVQGAFLNSGALGPPRPGTEGLWIMTTPNPRSGIRQSVYHAEKPSPELLKAVKQFFQK
ncbi:MAG: hypothetical protein AB7K24_33720 [Gemmataceae bacterium]